MVGAGSLIGLLLTVGMVLGAGLAAYQITMAPIERRPDWVNGTENERGRDRNPPI